MGQLRGQDKVVPIGQFVIENDAPGDFLLEGIPESSFCLVLFPGDVGIDLETGFGDRVGGALAGIQCGGQRGAVPASGYLGEKPVLDRVVLGAIRRIVQHENLDAESCREVKKVLLHNVVSAGIGAATVAKDHKGVGVGVSPLQMVCPHLCDMVAEELGSVVTVADGEVTGVCLDIIDAVRHYGLVCEVMVESLGLPVAYDLAFSLEIPDTLFLFGVHTDNRDSSAGTSVRNLVDLLKLGIPVRSLTHGKRLCERPFAQSGCGYHLLYNVAAHLYATFFEFSHNLCRVYVKPYHHLVLRKPHLVFFHNLIEHLHPVRILGKLAFGTATLSASPAIFWHISGQNFRNCLVNSVFTCMEKGTYGTNAGTDASHHERCEIVSLLVLIKRVIVHFVHLFECNWGFFIVNVI